MNDLYHILNRNERRRYYRNQLSVKIKLATAQGVFFADTIDLSHNGLLIKINDNYSPKIGETFSVQALEPPDAPSNNVIVRRLTRDKTVGLEFI